MSTELRFDGRVAVITGAGNGLGRSHALLLGSRGAKVVVNDLGGGAHGDGKSSAAADTVVAEIRAAGGEAVANYDSVEDGDKIIQSAIDAFGRVDIVVNNAGILRDTSFQKMSQADWDLIYRVHVLGAFKVTQAAWNHMREAGYGRILVTASAAGIYGNFGQANYSMAKLGLVGFSNTLAIEGRKKNVLVNAIAPIAGSRMTETVLPKELLDALKPEYVSPLVAWLTHESCTETGGLFEVGGGLITKLRWERTEGHSFRLGRPITPEGVRDHWESITDFAKTTHPADVNASMQPILGNIQKGPGRGGNEFIDADAAVGYEFPPAKSSYEARDVGLYAIAVGGVEDPTNSSDLQMTYELHSSGFRPLPTFAVVPALNAMVKLAAEGKQAPGLHYGFEKILHGEQYLEVLRPLPQSASLTHKTRVKDIFDKGKNALVITETRSFDETGTELFRNEVTSVVRGAGGWGGDRGPSTPAYAAPTRAPDATITQKTHANQALLYRLLGDWNPLHADPDFATGFGFPKPILHGLCTFGYAARHVIKSFAGNDPRLFKNIKARFTDSVFPGETLKTEMWKEGDTKVLFQSKAIERDKLVITGEVELHREVPSDRPATAPVAAKSAPAAAPAASNSGGEVTTREIFGVIRDYITSTAGVVGKIGTVFAIKLNGPDSEWTIDAKNGNGSVTEGASESADVTLALADADWLGIVAGKVDAQKLYFGGKLKISGNLMASQKLEFLKKIDPAAAAKSVAAQRGGAAPAAAPAPAPAPAAASGAPTTREIFGVIRDYVTSTAGLVAKVGTIFAIKLSAPDSAWTIDVKNGGGAVTEGASDKADVTLSLADSDWLDIVGGKADAQKLYFGGKLKIAGNLMASQKLQFLQKIDPAAAAKSVAAQRGSPAPANPLVSAPAATASKATEAPAAPPAGGFAATVFDGLRDRLAKNPALAGEVSAVVQFKVTEPASDWVVDLKSAPGSVTRGTNKAADTTLVLTDDDLGVLVKGTENVQKLFQHGRLRVLGDVRVAHRLGFLKGLI